MKRYVLIMSLLVLVVTAASAQRFRGGGFHGGGYAYHGGGFRGGYGYGGYRYYGGLYLGLGLGWGLGYYYNPYYYGYPYYGYPYYNYPPAYQQAPPQESNPPADSYNGNGNGNKGGYYNNDTIYSQKPATPGPGPSENNGSPSRQWVPAHWKHTDEGWIWIDGYWKNQ